jgi:LPXTG-motif cell wall-anchored protein
VGAGSTTISDDSGQPRLFPAGTSCWAEESGTGGADQHRVDHDSPANAVPVLTGQPDAVQELVVQAMNTFTDHSAVGSENDNLAYTGFAGSGLALLGLACVAFGAWLVRRRRA